MYTRSYPSRQNAPRPLPPDYGGTALTIPRREDTFSEETAPRPAVTPPPPHDGFGRRSRRPLSSRQEFPEPPPTPEAPPPFGGAGQPDAGNDPPPEQEVAVTSEHRSPLGSFLDPANLKSDDLLLLGLALLLLNDKDRPDGSSAADALLILAMLYIAGL